MSGLLGWECECGSQYSQKRSGGDEEQAKLTRWMNDHEGCDVEGEPVTDEDEERRLELEPVRWLPYEGNDDE